MSDIDTMEAGREMDALVAEKVMGWVRYRREEESGYWRIVFHDETNNIWCVYDANYETRMWALPSFSTDISAAWQVFLWLSERGIVRVSNGDGDSCDCDFIPDGRDELLYGQRLNDAHITAGTWELAICRAALKAVAADA